jgi:hypothetical protein
MRIIQRGACRTRPVKKSKAAPTPMNIFPSVKIEMYSAMNFSCLGIPMPTQKKSGRVSLTFFASASRSSLFSGPKGGESVPATRKPGKRACKTFANSSATPGLPQKKMAEPARSRMVTQIQNQIGSINSADRAVSLQPPHPHQRHSVRCGEQCVVQNASQFWVALSFAHAVQIRDRHISTFSVSHSIEEKFPCSILIEHADPNAENIYLFDLHSENTQPFNISTPQLLQTLRPNFFSSSAFEIWIMVGRPCGQQ